jgi:hypothetical protein
MVEHAAIYLMLTGFSFLVLITVELKKRKIEELNN